MDKRVEIAWPILNPALKKLVLDYLVFRFSDTAKLRMLESNLEYTPLEYFAEERSDGRIESFDSQAFLIHKAEVDFEDSWSTVKKERSHAQPALTSITSSKNHVRLRVKMLMATFKVRSILKSPIRSKSISPKVSPAW